MKRVVLPILSSLSALAFSASAFAFEAPELSVEDINALQNGDAIISVWKDRERAHKPTISKGGIDIMVPAADVFSIMLDCDRMTEVSKDIRECEVLETTDDGSWDIRKQKFAVSPLLPKFKTTFRTDYMVKPGQSYVMQVEKISGDLKVQEGRWDIIAIGPDETRVIYQAALKPSFPIPAKVIRKQVAIGIPDILRKLRDVAEADYAADLQNAAMPKRDDM
ncbi:MAG: SRPBCC family protein [Litorimonas sp.]